MYPVIGLVAQSGTSWEIRVSRSRNDQRVLSYPTEDAARAARATLQKAKEILLPKEPELRVQAVERTDRGYWRVRCLLDGKRKDYRCASEEEAHARAAELSQAQAKTVGEMVPPKLPACVTNGSGTPQEWRDALWWIAQRMMCAPRDETLRQLSRTIAGLASASKRIATEPDERKDALADLSAEEAKEAVERIRHRVLG